MKIVAKPHEKGVLPAWFWVGAGLACTAAIGFVAKFLPQGMIPACGFHQVTGWPCPSCGMTRMVLLLLDGEVSRAPGMNPFLFLVIAAFLAWVLAGMALRLLGRDLFLEISAGEEKWWWFAAILGFLANWVYLFLAGV